MQIGSSNPAFRNGVFTRTAAAADEGVMTLGGTVWKSAVLLGLVIASSLYTWSHVAQNPGQLGTNMLIGVIGGLILAMITIFKPNLAPVTAPLYAVVEGLALGSISYMYNARPGMEGLPTQAVMLTFAVFLVMLTLYQLRIIRATERFRSVIVTATAGIFVFYLATFALGFFGIQMPLVHSASPMGIGFSVLTAGVAAFFLILDFDLIEEGVQRGAPKRMEWYGGFTLLITLVWLYLELLRLLSKLRK